MTDLSERVLLQQAILNTAVRFGVGAFLAEMALYLLAALGLNPGGVVTLLGFLLLPFFQVQALRYLRKFEIGKRLGFINTFRVTSITSLIGAAGSALVLYLLCSLAGPETWNGFLKEAQVQMEQMKTSFPDAASRQNLDQAISQIKSFTPGMFAYQYFLLKMLLGVLAALIIALFFRSKVSGTEAKR